MKDLGDENPVLIVIDVQKGFLDEAFWGGNRNNKDAEVVCGHLVKKWRDLGHEIIHIRHSSANPTSPLHETSKGFAFHDEVQPLPHELVLTKSVNNAFIGTELQAILEARNAQVLVIVGLTTDHCVSTTTRMAANLGFETFLISDATATFDRIGIDGQKFTSDIIHATALASLNEEFATVLDSNTLLQLL